MLTSYRRVFAHPGAAAFSATGVVARLPISMMTLGIVLMVSAATGSYGTAGAVSAAYILGNAVFAVPHGRLADRFGQHRVLYVDTVVFGFATGMLVVASREHWATPWPHLWGFLAGMWIPQIGSMVRSRWAHLVASERERHTAFSVEAIADEVVFVTGPPLVTFLCTLWAPQAGLLAAIGVGTVGTLALAAQRGTEPPARQDRGDSPTDPLPWARLLPMCLAALALGCLFGAFEVATIAIAGEAGHKAVAGLILGGFSLGSMIAGVVTGALHWSTPLLKRFRIGMTALAVALVLLPFLGSLALLAVVLFAIGFTLAPTLIAMFSLLEEATPRSRLTESMAFLSTGISAGIAPGAWLAGIVADHAGGSAAYWVCVGSGLGGALASYLVAGTRTSLRP